MSVLPFKASPRDPGNPVYDFEQFTAYRAGYFAGIAYRSGSSDFYLVSRAPNGASTVLRTVHYPYAHATPNAVSAMGFTPQLNLVVAVQNPSYRPTGVAFGSYKGMYFTGRIGRYLAAGRWISYMPTGVADSGRIAGWAATGSPTHPHYYVVTWSGVTARPQTLADVGSVHPSVMIDGYGDIAWKGTNGFAVVRKADGSTHELDAGSNAAPVNITLAAASQDSFYAAATNGVFRFTASGKVPAGAAVQGSRLTTASAAASWVDTAGPRGDLVTGMQSGVLRLADGRRVTMPAQALPPSALSRVFTRTGVLAYTATDRRVHFLTCH